MKCPFCDTRNVKSTDWDETDSFNATETFECDCGCVFEVKYFWDDDEWATNEPDDVTTCYEPSIDHLYNNIVGLSWEVWEGRVEVNLGNVTKSYPLVEYEEMLQRRRVTDLCRLRYDTDKPSPDQLQNFWVGGAGG